MKKLTVIILTILLFPIGIKAQNVFGLNHKEVSDELKKNGFNFVKHLQLTSDLSFDQYSIQEDGKYNLICYFNKKEICFEFKEIIPATNVFSTIQSLNNKYIRVDDMHWINKNGSVKVTYAPPTDGTFYVAFTALDIPE